MPTLTRWFIKTSLVCLALALISGLLMAVRAVFNVTLLYGLFPVYIHLLVFGWLTQLVFGVVFWMFPKYSTEKARGSETLGWWTYILLNVGLLLRAVAEPIQSMHPNPVAGWALVASAIIQFSAGATFVANSWKRVRVK